MFRILVMVVLGIVVLTATPVDAQIFRRNARRTAQAIEAAQQAQRNRAQPNKTRQFAPQRRQPNAKRKNELKLAEAKKSTDAPQAAGKRPVAAKPATPTAARVAVQPQGQPQPQPQPQRYAVYYNFQTKQTFLRPIPPNAATPNSTIPQNLAVQRSTAQSRQPVTVGGVAVPATSSQTGTLTSSPGPQPVKPIVAAPIAAAPKAEPAATNPTPANAPKQTFSILEIDK